MFLTRFASKVTLVHRRDTLRASKIMQDKARANPKIAWMLDHEVDDDQRHRQGRSDRRWCVRSNKTGATTEIPVHGVFVAIGHTPNTALFRGQLELDQNGYIMTHDGAEDERAPACSRAATCRITSTARRSPRPGSGCMAAIDAEHYLDNIPEHLASRLAVRSTAEFAKIAERS